MFRSEAKSRSHITRLPVDVSHSEPVLGDSRGGEPEHLAEDRRRGPARLGSGRAAFLPGKRARSSFCVLCVLVP